MLWLVGVRWWLQAINAYRSAYGSARDMEIPSVADSFASPSLATTWQIMRASMANVSEPDLLRLKARIRRRWALLLPVHVFVLIPSLIGTVISIQALLG
jgi:hypothetical protein